MHDRVCKCDWCGKLWTTEVVELCEECRDSGLKSPRMAEPGKLEAMIFDAIRVLYRAAGAACQVERERRAAEAGATASAGPALDRGQSHECVNLDSGLDPLP